MGTDFSRALDTFQKQRRIQIFSLSFPLAFDLSHSFGGLRGFGIFNGPSVSSENGGVSEPEVDLPRITNELASTRGRQLSTVVADVASNFSFFVGGSGEPDTSSCAWVIANRRVTTTALMDEIFVLII